MNWTDSSFDLAQLGKGVQMNVETESRGVGWSGELEGEKAEPG